MLDGRAPDPCVELQAVAAVPADEDGVGRLRDCHALDAEEAVAGLDPCVHGQEPRADDRAAVRLGAQRQRDAGGRWEVAIGSAACHGPGRAGLGVVVPRPTPPTIAGTGWGSGVLYACRMADGLTLVCPVRGRLKVTGRSADGLTPSEERYRVEAIKYLIDRGYPKENFLIEPVVKRFGNSGRNSFRADFAVLDRPAADVGRAVDDVLDHAVLLAEIKRDSASAESAKRFQVQPLLGFAAKESCVALYWDNVDHRVFWQTSDDGTRVIHEGPIASLTGFGHAPGAKALVIDDLRSDASLKGIFDRIEDILHGASIGPSKRFSVMLQLLIAKLHDEHEHMVVTSQPLVVQDYRSLGVSAANGKTAFNELLKSAAQYYERHLPEPVAKTLNIPDDAFLEVMAVFAPNRITAMKHSVIQEFYMYFARGLYKWDLAQYFTPPALTDFIIDVINPQWNEDVRDPACGSADFLTAAFRRGQEFPDYASRIWGADVSTEAVQVAVLNMVLNGDGKSNIRHEDSLATVKANQGKWDVLVCNPPFGIRILERDLDKLKKFDLGHRHELKDGRWKKTKEPLASQETGILFAELCVRLARPGTGRVALVVPNGYLGNRSGKYVQLRQWLLLNARIAAVVALPRFTFKGSGADVSASVVFLERRDEPLAKIEDVEQYDIAFQVIDKVGWATADKKALPTYRRDEADGTFLLDEDAEMMLDSDFEAVLHRLRASDAAHDFSWLTKNIDGYSVTAEPDEDAWSLSSLAITADASLTLDPKRLSKKFVSVVNDIKAVEHFTFGDVFEFGAEGVYWNGDAAVTEQGEDYAYVELQNVESGTYRSEIVKGWALPSRAKHVAETGDFFVGGLWSSVRKWMLIGDVEKNVRVTNGMHRMRLLPAHEDKRIDIVAALCSEAYRVQMRGLSRGSDGLAEISSDDLAAIVVPVIKDPAVRVELQPFVDQLMKGFTTVEAKVSSLLHDGRLPLPEIPKRESHVMVL